MFQIFLFAFFWIGKSLFGQEGEPPFFPLEETEQPGTAGEGRFFYEFLYMLFILGLMIAVMIAASWLIKRMLSTRVQGTNMTSDIKILEQRAISAKSSLYLVSIKGETFLIGESQNGLEKIASLQEKV